MLRPTSAHTVFRTELLSMSAYSVTDAAGFIKLDAMENPYSWPEEITELWLQKLRHCPLNRYPDPGAKQLCTTLQKLNKVPPDCSLMLGNGSDEIIQIVLMALAADKTVLAPEPGFVMYRQIAQCLGLNYQGIALLENDFGLDLPAMLDAIKRCQPGIIFLAYPNNPTGNLFDREAVYEILRQTSGLVILDEAYAPFADASFMSETAHFDNLLVMRTVSKLGLAGLRLGYLVGKTALIEQLHKIRLPYNINTLTQISADFALSHASLFTDQIQTLCQQRQYLFEQLNQLAGIRAFPSAANFILFRCPENSANRLFENLKQQGILIKNTSPQGGLLTDTLRVTIGKPEENASFIGALQNGLAQL